MWDTRKLFEDRLLFCSEMCCSVRPSPKNKSAKQTFAPAEVLTGDSFLRNLLEPSRQARQSEVIRKKILLWRHLDESGKREHEQAKVEEKARKRALYKLQHEKWDLSQTSRQYRIYNGHSKSNHHSIMIMEQYSVWTRVFVRHDLATSDLNTRWNEDLFII